MTRIGGVAALILAAVLAYRVIPQIRLVGETTVALHARVVERAGEKKCSLVNSSIVGVLFRGG